MRLQDHIEKATARTMEGIFRSARAMPEDKLTWQPMDEGRTVLDQLQEVSSAANFFSACLDKKGDPQLTDEDFAKSREARQAWDTIDKCEAACKENTEKLFAKIRSLSDEDLSHTFKFDGSDQEYSLADIAAFHQTHLSYHLGQINYMQTLYGDKDQH